VRRTQRANAGAKIFPLPLFAPQNRTWRGSACGMLVSATFDDATLSQVHARRRHARARAQALEDARAAQFTARKNFAPKVDCVASTARSQRENARISAK
jgi:hypothetical protein